MELDQTRRELISRLRGGLTRPGNSVTVTHSLDHPALKDPPLIRGEQPDLLGRGLGHTLIIGLVKSEPDLTDDESLRQYQVFGNYRDPETNELAILHLAILREFRELAQAALEEAGLTDNSYFIWDFPTTDSRPR